MHNGNIPHAGPSNAARFRQNYARLRSHYPHNILRKDTHTHTGAQNVRIHVKQSESHDSRRSSNYAGREEHKNSQVMLVVVVLLAGEKKKRAQV